MKGKQTQPLSTLGVTNKVSGWAKHWYQFSLLNEKVFWDVVLSASLWIDNAFWPNGGWLLFPLCKADRSNISSNHNLLLSTVIVVWLRATKAFSYHMFLICFEAPRIPSRDDGKTCGAVLLSLLGFHCSGLKIEPCGSLGSTWKPHVTCTTLQFPKDKKH